MPESSPARDIATAAALGLVGSLPGLGAISATAQAALSAAARQRDEEWWAMVSARVAHLERQLDRVLQFDDPQFVAAAYRLSRAAQETADDAKRRALAAILADSGSWSTLPADDRERLEQLVRELSGRDIVVLHAFQDPRGWVEAREPGAAAGYESMMMGSTGSFVDQHLARGLATSGASLRTTISGLQRRGLVEVPLSTTMTGGGILQKRTTSAGDELLAFIGAIE
jgi:hypothetical protein